MRQSLAVILTMALLAVGITAGAVAIASSGGGEEESAQPAPQPQPASPEPTAPTPAEEPAPGGDAVAGEEVFATAGCGSCHALAAAGSSGGAGPNLDDVKPSFEATVEQVTEGGGGMPAFRDSLSEQQILDVSAFVAAATSGG
jgi:mono/diheme cytochrome c family protein